MADLALGEVFAGHRIDRVAGRGGMGVVYRATDLALDRAVALKVIAPALADDPGFRDRFKRESRIAASIHHPHIVTVHRAGEEAGRLFITMHHVEGTDLRALLIGGGPLEPSRACRLVAQVADALDAAHARGLVHRDVKPANILVAGDGEAEHAYLTDFGLTKSTSSDSGLTGTGQFVGTLDYIAPEQVEGKGADARADVYALGCVLYHLLTGSVPFDEDSEIAKIYAHVSKTPQPVRALRPEVPAALEAVVARAMEKEPSKRFQSAGDFGRAAVAACEGRAAAEQGSVAEGQAAPWDASVVRETVVDRDVVSGGEPRAKVFALAAAVGVAVVVAVLALTSGGGEDPTDGARGQATPASGAPAGSEGRVAATIPVPKHPQGIAVVGEDVFVASDAEGLVERIDTRTNKAAGLRAVAPDPTWLAAGDGVLWEASTESEAVGRLRTPALEHLGTPVVRTGRRPSAIAAGGPEVWITEAAAGAASRIDPRTGKVRETVEVGDEPLAVAFDERGSFWVSNHGSGTIQRIDPDDESLVGDEIEVGPNPRGLAIAEGHVWVAVSGEGTVVRVSLDSDTVVGDPIAVGDTPVAVAAGEGSIWVVNQVDGTVTRIDAKTAKVVGEPIDVGKEPISVAVGVGAVWVSNASDDTVTRIDP